LYAVQIALKELLIEMAENQPAISQHNFGVRVKARTTLKCPLDIFLHIAILLTNCTLGD
jgi:hypothetical protein